MFRLTTRSIHTTARLFKPNPAHIIGGHKATLKNPNTSEEAKAHSREVLEHSKEILDSELDGGDVAKHSTADHHEGHHPNHVAGGLKASIKNPNTGEEARERAKDRLKHHDY